MDDELVRQLRAMANAIEPATILVIGSGLESELRNYQAQHPDCTLRHLPLASLEDGLTGMGHVDMVILHAALEQVDRPTGTHLLATLRDVHASHVIAVVPAEADWPRPDDPWDQTAFFALGMVHAGAYATSLGQKHIYRFDIDSYKTTPDWLSPKDWAHPERWDKDWW